MTTGRTLQGPFADPIRKHLETARRQISQGQLKQAALTLNQAQRILLPGGVLYFSCEIAPEDGPDLVLQASGRYAHKRSHVEALCAQAGFEIEVEELVLRREAGEPVQGLLITAHKPAAADSHPAA